MKFRPASTCRMGASTCWAKEPKSMLEMSETFDFLPLSFVVILLISRICAPNWHE